MRALVQRVTRASVRSFDSDRGEWATVGEIDAGLCVLVGVTHDDDAATAAAMAGKLAGLRIFDDDEGVMNRSVLDVGGAALVVSQFTLYGDTSKGRRPSWIAAAPPAHAEPLVEALADALRRAGVPVATGRFRTQMEVDLVNDGPVTLLLEVG